VLAFPARRCRHAKVLSLSRTRNPHAVFSTPLHIYRREAKVEFSFKSENLPPLFRTHDLPHFFSKLPNVYSAR
jgi:hypothetical protein